MVRARVRADGAGARAVPDEEPTFGYFPTVYYYQGRVRERMKIEGFADSYRQNPKARIN